MSIIKNCAALLAFRACKIEVTDLHVSDSLSTLASLLLHGHAVPKRLRSCQAVVIFGRFARQIELLLVIETFRVQL